MLFTHYHKYFCVVFTTQMLFISQAALSQDRSESPSKISYDREAACDFIMARLYEASQEIFENSADAINLSTQQQGQPRTALYKSRGISAEYFISNKNIHIINLLLEESRFPDSTRNEIYILRRIAANPSDTDQDKITLQCDMLQADILFENKSLKNLQITQAVD